MKKPIMIVLILLTLIICCCVVCLGIVYLTMGKGFNGPFMLQNKLNIPESVSYIRYYRSGPPMPTSEYLDILVEGGKLVVREGALLNSNGQQPKLSRQVTAGDMAGITSIINNEDITLYENRGQDCTGGSSSFIEFEQDGQRYKVHSTKDELCIQDGGLLHTKKTRQDFSKIENALLDYLSI